MLWSGDCASPLSAALQLLAIETVRPFSGSLALFVAAAIALAALAGAASHPRESELPKRYRKAPYSVMSLSVGHPNRGWQLRPKRLKKTRFMAIKRGSRSNVYGHPALVKMLHRSARDLARSARGSVMLVGDLSSRAGGALAKHVSHQSGRDADVGFFAVDAKGKSVKLDRFVAFKGDGTAADGSKLRFDDWRNWLLVQGWLRDHRAHLQHIFVSKALRRRLLSFARADKRYRKRALAAAKLLLEPTDSSSHNDHFHVRIACPKRQKDICKPLPKR